MTNQHLAHAPIIKSTDWQIRWVGVTALTWIVSVLALASWSAFYVPASEPALPTVIALLVPVVAFVAAMFLSKDLRAVAMNLDPVLLTEFQAWRILGGLFLAVYAFGHLPGLFAWPAGLGDVVIGLAAPFMAWRLRNDPGFLNSRRFLRFNLLGLADFIVAVATAKPALCSAGRWHTGPEPPSSGSGTCWRACWPVVADLSRQVRPGRPIQPSNAG